MIFYLTFLSPLTSLFDFFSLFSESASLLTRVLSLPHSSSDQIPNFSLNLNLKRLSLSLHLKSNLNKCLSSLFIKQQSYGLGRDWLVFGELLVEIWVWVVELWFWYWVDLMGLDFCWFGGGLRCRWVRPNPNQNHIVVWSCIVLHWCCRRSRRLVLHNSPAWCVVPHATLISSPCSPQLAANLSQSSCGCEIWDGAVDLRFGMVPMGLRFVVVGSDVVLWIWWQF